MHPVPIWPVLASRLSLIVQLLRPTSAQLHALALVPEQMMLEGRPLSLRGGRPHPLWGGKRAAAAAAAAAGLLGTSLHRP